MFRNQGFSRSLREFAIGLVTLSVAGPWESGCGSAAIRAAEPTVRYNKAAWIRFEGPIFPHSAHLFYRQLGRAQAAGADLLIVEIDSPGGEVHSSLEVANRLLSVDWARTVAFVRKQAISGAAIMALGCDEILMAPAALIGDAGPIYQAEDSLFRHAPEKIRSILVAEIRKLASATGRPEALAAAMVDAKLEVYQCTHRQTGELRLMSQPDLQAKGGVGLWERGPLIPESRQELFLTLNGRRAMELKLSEGLAMDRLDLIDRFHLDTDFLELQIRAVDVAVLILNNPWVTGLLFVVGLVALLVELSAPGISIGGLLAGLCFGLFFWSRFLGGTSGWLEVVLFVAGLLFLIAEVLVIPGVGIAGVSGLLLMVSALILANQDYRPMDGLAPGTPVNSLLLLFGTGAVVVVFLGLVTHYTGRIPVLGRFVTEPPPFDPAVGQLVGGGPESPAWPPLQIGDCGVTISPLRPGGKVMVGQQTIDVVTEGEFVESGTQVRILTIQGNRVVVRPIELTG